MHVLVAPSLLDARVAGWMHEHANPTLTLWMRAATTLGAPTLVIAAACVLAGTLLYQRDRLRALQVGLCVPLGVLLNTGLKLVLERARPDHDFWLVDAIGYSFPSGHTAAATLFFGCVTYVAWRKLPGLRARIAISAILFGLVQLVALSRIYLGVHYLTDIVAAEFVAFLWLAVSLSTLEVFYPRQSGLPPSTHNVDNPP